jgi:hypothetical protein
MRIRIHKAIESGSNPDPDADPDPQPWYIGPLRKYLIKVIPVVCDISIYLERFAKKHAQHENILFE